MKLRPILSAFLLFFGNLFFALASDTNVFHISIFRDTSNNLAVDSIKSLLSANQSLFIPSDKFNDSFDPHVTYWLYLKPPQADTAQEYVLTFHVWVSLMEVYTYPFSAVSAYGGRMVSGRLKTLSGCNVILKPGHEGNLVKVQNKLWSEVSVKDMELIPLHMFQKQKEKYNLVQGFIQGFFWLMLIYNLLLYFIVRKKIHLFYVLYIFFNSLFIFFTFSYSETYIFPDNYKLNFIFFPFQLLGMFFYLMFMRTILLNHCTSYTSSFDRKFFLPFIYFILVLNLAIGSTFFYRVDIAVAGSDLSNLLISLAGMFIFIYFYRGADWFLRTIILGSIISLVFGWGNVLYGLLGLPADNLLYEIGLLIELLLLTYALNKLHFEDQFKAELMKHQLERELEDKNKELVYQAIQISAKDETIASIKEKLKGLVSPGKPSTVIMNELGLESSLNRNLWKEFEIHFNETHPGFYRILMSNYPELTQNEIRLCAFLKLNLNTKEIASITQKSARSIEVMRSRIRQKMNLDRDTNLNLILSQLQETV